MRDANVADGWTQIADLVAEVVAQVAQSGWNPTLVLALSRGGFIPSSMIAQLLDVRDLVGVDVRKDEHGRRSIGHFVTLGRLDGQRVLIVDDGIVTGNLLPMTASAVRSMGGEPRTCALVSEGRCPAPDYLAQTLAAIPRFPWEVKGRLDEEPLQGASTCHHRP